MVVRQHQCRGAAPEGVLEQPPIADAMRADRTAGDQFVADQSARPVEVDNEQNFLVERADLALQPVEEGPLERQQDIAGPYQSIQPGSAPRSRARRVCAAVPTSKATSTRNVGLLFMRP